MRPAASLQIWTRLSVPDRAAVAEAIVGILTEEVDNEWIGQESSHPSATAGRGLPAAIQSQAGVAEP
jgi:hypothetical protein